MSGTLKSKQAHWQSKSSNALKVRALFAQQCSLLQTQCYVCGVVVLDALWSRGAVDANGVGVQRVEVGTRQQNTG